jgi:hypothetical protein
MFDSSRRKPFNNLMGGEVITKRATASSRESGGCVRKAVELTSGDLSLIRDTGLRIGRIGGKKLLPPNAAGVGEIIVPAENEVNVREKPNRSAISASTTS